MSLAERELILFYVLDRDQFSIRLLSHVLKDRTYFRGQGAVTRIF